jgi:hypothetical protein
MHHDYMLITLCIVAPLVNYLSHLKKIGNLIHAHESSKILLQMVDYYPPVGNEAFLGIFGTPALLWRVLHFVGYSDPPQYFWAQKHVYGEPWFEVKMSIPACPSAPQYQGWKADSE